MFPEVRRTITLPFFTRLQHLKNLGEGRGERLLRRTLRLRLLFKQSIEPPLLKDPRHPFTMAQAL
jgi:hypothetical protein